MEISEGNWLTQLVIAASLSSKSSVIQYDELGDPELLVKSPTGTVYQAYPVIAKYERYKVRLCKTPEGRMCLLKVATNSNYNGDIEREVYLLRDMRREDENAPTVKSRTRSFFPEVVECFNGGEKHGNRMIAILGFAPDIESFDQLKILHRVISSKKENDKNENLRLDAKTASWVWGKLLKVLGFAHDINIVNGAINDSNVMLVPDEHGIVVFNWGRAVVSNADQAKFADIRNAASAVLMSLQADKNGRLMHDDLYLDPQQKEEFENYFRRILSGEVMGLSAYDLKDQFYEMIYGFWGQEFYPYTTFDRS